MRRTLISLMLAFAAQAQVLAVAHGAEFEHREFDATLEAPFTAPAQGSGERTFTLTFSYPGVETPQDVSWRLELTGLGGQLVRRWDGVQRIGADPVSVQVRWAARAEAPELPDGVYHVRMQASAHDAGASLAADTGEVVEQTWDVALGTTPAIATPAFRPLPTAKGRAPGLVATPAAAPAIASLPYTVYYGNLHSQTNHSDGGGDLASCKGAQEPQSGAQGPAEAFEYARAHGLDLLVASEHNHMYDGSDGTDPAASPARAKALYQSGLAAASDYNAAHPGFLAVYGMEWGVITNGGHLNIFNAPELLEWEVNAAGELIGDTLTPKNDYAALYTLMRQRGWIGQFNHPSLNKQFKVNGVGLGYTADGDQVMMLCEVLNSAAFSVSTMENEKGRSRYETACQKALEAGYHVAFASNQDNHCANWGASYSNRTALLIPTGTALTQVSFLDALRARRVFATMDKSSQLILTANGHLMGERFASSGPLNLVANFASSDGKQAAMVELLEGVPGRNGAVTVLAPSASATITPSDGEHFYYARVTQTDGNMLWSAPVWVTQTASPGGTRGGSSAGSTRAGSGDAAAPAAPKASATKKKTRRTTKARARKRALSRH
ncbi:MAG: CehA/McbA family metallohydrolase [Gammaproteobacteria bacterium]